VSDVAPKHFETTQAEKKVEWMIRAKLADKPVYYETNKKP
jgi:hypothetical protein